MTATIALGVAALATIVALAPSASAAKRVDSYFGNPTSSTTASTGGLFNGPRGVAVNDATGSVYVVDGAKHRVQQFDASNNFVRAWGTDVVNTGAPNNNAVANSFEICDTTAGNTAADCKIGVTGGTGTGGQLNNPQGIAVNQATGNVYVTEGSRFRVQEFTATGQFVRAWGLDVITNTGTPANSNGTGFEVCDTQHPTTPNTPADCKAGVGGNVGGAFASTFAGHPSVVPAGALNAGNVLVADPGNQRVQEFTSTGVFVRTFGYDVVQPGGAGEVVGAPVNERQEVTLGGAFDGMCFCILPITGGTFTLTLSGQTAVIPYNATADGVDAALEALSNIGAGGVAVSGNAGGPWAIEFTGSLAGTDVAELTANPAGLIPAGATATVATTAPGGVPAPMYEICTVGSQCKAGAAGNGLGQFGASEPKRVVADRAGGIYTAERSPNARVQKFTGSGLVPEVFVTASTHQETQPELAYDSVADRVFVARDQHSSVIGTCVPLLPQALIFEYSTTGALIDTHGSCTTIALAVPAGLAVRPSNGRIYLTATSLFTAEFTSAVRNRVWVFDDNGATPAIATVNPATNVTSSTADVSATVNPNSIDNLLAPTSWRIQYSRNGVDWLDVSTGSIPVANTTPVAVSGSVAGLSPNTTYRLRVVTQKPFANLEVASPELPFVTDAVAPEIRTTATQSVESTAATVSARVNPHGTPTSYRFEWGEVGGFDNVAPVPDGSVGSGPAFVLVSEQLTGLEPGTTYQYRVVALSASEGSTVGPTRTFTTPSQQAAGPQGRAYELVSPADKVGGSGVGTWYAGVASHSTAGFPAFDGDRFVSASFYGGTLADGGFSYASDATYGERTPVGWVNRPGFNRPGGFGKAPLAQAPLMKSSSDDLLLSSWTAQVQMRLFEEQADMLGTGDVQGFWLRDWVGRWEPLGPVAPEQAVSTESADYSSIVAADGGRALVWGVMRGLAGTGDPTHPSFTGGADDLVCPIPSTCNGNVYVDDVTAGLSDSFPGVAPALANVCVGSGAGRTAIPSVVGGKIVAEACPPAAVDRPARLISPRGASVPLTEPQGLLSRDGSRAFFMSPDHSQVANLAACSGTGAATACPPQLYVRQRNGDGGVVTRWISQTTVADQDASLVAPAVFEGATPDGDKVFFRTASPLTPDDPNGPCGAPCTTGAPNANSVDLYMYDLSSGADPAGGTLTRISAGPNGGGDGNVMTDPVAIANDTVSSLRAIGDDGSRVYFTTAAPLPGVPASTAGGVTSPGGTVSQTATKSLYLYDANRSPAQRWRFIASLPATSAMGECAAKGSIMDASGLAGGEGLVDRIAVPGGGHCVRASADGAFITFFTDGRLTADDPDGVSGDVYAYDAIADELTRLSAPQGGVGGSYRCVTQGVGAGARCYGDPVISGSGAKWALSQVTDPGDLADRTVFFESASRLVPEDHNDAFDVYQWHNGKLSLLSTGAADAEDALYRGNDRTGTNVYISTREALTWQDHDKVLDIYTARIGGGIAQPDPPPLCSLLAGSCQTPPAGGVSADTPSTALGGENAVSGPRTRLTVAQPSAKARRAAARRGVISVRIRSDAAATAAAAATARIGKKVRRVGRGSVSFDQAGSKTITVRLSRMARKRLAAGEGLRVRVVVTASGARAQSLSVLLRRAGR